MLGFTLTSLPVICSNEGSVIKYLSREHQYFAGFGEAYFSSVNNTSQKCWRTHTKAVSNIVVISGSIHFMFSTADALHYPPRHAVSLESATPQLLTIQPLTWFSFRGLEDANNTLINISSLPHDPSELLKYYGPIQNALTV